MWDPNILDPLQVDQYLLKVGEMWKRSHGMTEEIALKLLVKNQFDISQTLTQMKEKP